MFIATLLTGGSVLEPATIEALRNAWGGGDIRWLHGGVAAEFPLEAPPVHQWTVWADLQALGVDLAVQPAENRCKRLLLADMDSTMIRQECIDELAEVAGVGDRVRAITARAMNGELDFDGALRERVGLLAGLPETVIAEVLATRITHMPGRCCAVGHDEGAWRPCRAGVGRVHGLYRCGRGGLGVRRAPGESA